jgi:hypothetical protein
MLKEIKDLLGINKPKNIFHPFFGKLNLAKNEFHNQWFWNGVVTFEGQSIALRIYSGKEEPSEKYVNFFTNTMKNLDWLIKESSPFVKHSFEIWTNKAYFEYFLDEFKCVSLDIPVECNAENNWQITFARRSDEDFVFTIYVVNNKVESTDLD